MRGADAWDVLMPRTDGGVAAQASGVALVLLLTIPLARRWRLVTLWVGVALLVAGLFALRAVH